MSTKDNIRVLVFVVGCEGYGIQSILLDQYRLSRDFGIEFHYVCLQPGNLYQKLVNAGADVKVIESPIPKPYPPNLFKVISVFLSSLGPGFRVFRKLRSYLKEQKPDLVYCHTLTEQILSGLAAKSCHIKSVGHFHGMLNRKRNFGLSRVIVSIVFNWALDMGISVSNSARNSLWGPIRKKTCTIYNCGDFHSISETAQRMAKEENSPAADVICIGRLVPLKKQDILIKALGILARDGLRLRTLLVGGGNEDTNSYYLKLKELISTLQLEDDVTFTGYIAVPYGMLAKAKVSVLCCTVEGYGLVVPESMICKTPIIVADAGGGGELVEDGVTGLKYIPDNPESLAKCLRKIISDDNMTKQLVERAYNNVVENFTVESHMRQLRDKFHELLS